MEHTHTPLHYFLISDSVGETAQKISGAAFAQFPTVHKVCHKYNFISNINDLQPALDHAATVNGLIFLTLADNHLAEHAEQFCKEHQLTCYNLIQPFVVEIEQRTNQHPSHAIGAQHELSDKYFHRIQAMEYCMSFDDGKDPKGFEEADIILLGVSRTGKTPLSMYLAMLGYKAANLPLIPENDLPDVLFTLDKNKIIGLTNQVDVINRHRDARMKEYGIDGPTKYSSPERIKEEFEYANKVYQKLDCQTLDVSARSIEESAAMIIKLLALPTYED